MAAASLAYSLHFVLAPGRAEKLTASGKLEGSGGYHSLIVGAGLSGAVVARELAEQGKKVLVVDKREHVGGNCFDYVDKASGFRVAEYGAWRAVLSLCFGRCCPGSLAASFHIHSCSLPFTCLRILFARPPLSPPPAGPHFFHTQSERVWSYVNRFSEWTPWEHRVMARIGDHHVPVPVNIDTVNTLFGLTIKDEGEMDAWLATEQVPCAAPANSRDVALSRVGHRLYDMLFSGYTKKQWDKGPEELEASVLARIPVRNNRDDRYFTDRWQALPRHGYTSFIGNILDHPNIEVSGAPARAQHRLSA